MPAVSEILLCEDGTVAVVLVVLMRSSPFFGCAGHEVCARRSDQSAYPSQARATPTGIAIFG